MNDNRFDDPERTLDRFPAMDADGSSGHDPRGSSAGGRAAAGQPAAGDGPDGDSPAGAQPKAWDPITRMLFRFFFAFFLVYTLPFPLDRVPRIGSWVNRGLTGFWNAAVPWIGEHVLKLAQPITIRPGGSGDTTWNYVQLLAFFVVSILATAVWSVLDRRRREYTRLHRWLRVLLRFSLGFTMCVYGAAKVIRSQFPFPPYERLLEPYGMSSPMALLWTFMGYSLPYNVFTGAGEMLAGILMFFRRTTTLGALLGIVVLSNVVMLNFSYDVPVKLFSTVLLAMAIFLVVPDARRLTNAFILNRPVVPRTMPALFRTRWKNNVAVVGGVLFAGWSVYATLHQSAQGRRFGDRAPRSVLQGVWEVEEFARNADVVPPLVTDTMRWRRVLFAGEGRVSLVLMNDSMRMYRAQVDTAGKTVALIGGTEPVARLAWERPAADRLILTGTAGPDSVRVGLRLRPDSSLLLIRRGYRWINERPYNR
jgi:hypothetical protein